MLQPEPTCAEDAAENALPTEIDITPLPVALAIDIRPHPRFDRPLESNVRTVNLLNSPPWIQVMQSVYHHPNLPILLQVLLEDVTAAFLAVRIAGVLGPRAAPLLAAVLLTASHLTASLAAGGVQGVLEGALVDVFLGAAVVAVVQRSADVWWFWGVHFAMDMTQYVTQGVRS